MNFHIPTDRWTLDEDSLQAEDFEKQEAIGEINSSFLQMGDWNLPIIYGIVDNFEEQSQEVQESSVKMLSKAIG
jgi:hypothetical protein